MSGLLSAPFGRVAHFFCGGQSGGSKLGGGGPDKEAPCGIDKSPGQPIFQQQEKNQLLCFLFSRLFKPHRARKGHREDHSQKMKYQFLKANTKRG